MKAKGKEIVPPLRSVVGRVRLEDGQWLFTLDCGHRIAKPGISLAEGSRARRYRCLVCRYSAMRTNGRPVIDGIATDLSVVEVPCPACGAVVGQLCMGRTRRVASTHYKRRDNAKTQRRGLPPRWT